jgi:HPt (histidine-containing phosphotransfer) domain-containing protein
MKKIPSDSVLNEQIVNGLKQLNTDDKPQFFSELVELFQRSAPPVLQEIVDFQTKLDWKMAGRAAHRLKGSASNIGAAKMAQLCQQFKDECDSGEANAEGSGEILNLIKAAFGEASLELTSHKS